MSGQKLFNSKSQPIPELRRDLQPIPIKENGDSYLYFHDERGYASSEFALHRDAGQLLTLFDGTTSITDLKPSLNGNISEHDLLQFVQLLDKHRLLASNYFEKHAKQIEGQYEHSNIHPSSVAGSSFPKDPDELKQYLDRAFAEHTPDENEFANSAKALYAPHIDPRVALESYVKAFAPIRNIKPQRVVILATSHYAGLYTNFYKNAPFILINKDFQLPLSTIPRDQNAINRLQDESGNYGITIRDRAHRMEHSIEMHLLFLSYLWDHEYEIVPFLIGGLDDLFYMENGHLGQQLSSFSDLLQAQFGDEETFFLISGDLAHFGKKFGDDFAAATKFSEVKRFDQKFLEFGASNQPSKMLELVKEDFDPYRICGFPPLYTFLQAKPDLQGKVIDYGLWNEQKRESAVTFGSIIFE